METQLQINFPLELAFNLRMQDEEFKHEIKTLALIKLFELGKISSGKCASILGISRIAFFEALAKYNVDMYNDVSEETLKQDRKNA